MRAAAAVRRHFRPRRPSLRSLACLALVPALPACTARTLGEPQIDPAITRTTSGPIVVNRNVDLLFLVDDSSSMRASQDNLLRNFPVLMNALEGIPGGLPNVHIAVASSDMGAGDGSIAGCDATGGKNGVFQYTARGNCTATGLDPGATFISNVGGVKNYTGNLSEVFSCIAALGDFGCGFEQPFAAMTRALGADGQPPPLENQGFLRPDAYLAVVLITNEDDCSVQPGIPIYDTTANMTLADPLGPVTNFRCNEFGHICDGAPPSRHAPGGDVNATKTYASCQPAESSGLLRTVAETAARLKALKADPEQVIFAAITGPETPYTVHWKTPVANDSGPWPEVSHSCTASDGSFADPSVRTSALVREFGANGLVLPICADDFAPALGRIADKIIDHFSKPCVVGAVAKRPGSASDDCSVISTSPNGAGGLAESTLPACADNGGVGPCWQFGSADASCAGQTVDIVRDPAAPIPTAQTITVQCALCAPGVSDPTRGCP
jgi:hypothetical protein